MSSVFAVCDIETDYAVRMMEYLNRRNLPYDWEIRFFTNTEALCAFGRKKKIELLLISERAMCDEVHRLKAGKTILLSENRDTVPEGMPSVYKYQSSAQVVREVLDCYSAQQAAENPSHGMRKRRCRLTGVFGLFDPVRQMLFTLTLGQILAESERILYVHLLKHAGLMCLTGEEAERTLSELLYFYRQGKQGLFRRLPGMVRQIGKLDYIPAPFFSEDLGEMSSEEWTRFLQDLAEGGGYDRVILDLGNGVRGLTEVLKTCDDVFLLSGEDAFSTERRRLLEEELGPGLKDMCRWLCPPEIGGIRQGRWFPESLPASRLGEYIRKHVA